eukprot:scaffold193069_cov27-Tisochrysis_lutea.AAC.1
MLAAKMIRWRRVLPGIDVARVVAKDCAVLSADLGWAMRCLIMLVERMPRSEVSMQQAKELCQARYRARLTFMVILMKWIGLIKATKYTLEALMSCKIEGLTLSQHASGAHAMRARTCVCVCVCELELLVEVRPRDAFTVAAVECGVSGRLPLPRSVWFSMSSSTQEQVL